MALYQLLLIQDHLLLKIFYFVFVLFDIDGIVVSYKLLLIQLRHHVVLSKTSLKTNGVFSITSINTKYESSLTKKPATNKWAGFRHTSYFGNQAIIVHFAP